MTKKDEEIAKFLATVDQVKYPRWKVVSGRTWEGDSLDTPSSVDEPNSWRGQDIDEKVIERADIDTLILSLQATRDKLRKKMDGRIVLVQDFDGEEYGLYWAELGKERDEVYCARVKRAQANEREQEAAQVKQYKELKKKFGDKI